MEPVLIDHFPDWLKAYDPILLLTAVALSVLLVIILFVLLIKRVRRKASITGLLIPSFQIAPLGRDAFLKLNNPGERLTLLTLELLEQPNIHVKNQVAGHVLTTAVTYSILLESTNNDKIGTDFKIAVTFVDDHRKTYRQVFSLNPIKSLSIHRIR